FLPQTGRLDRLSLPVNIARVDAGVRQGDHVTPFYDPMIAKIIAQGPDRESALTGLRAALASTDVIGCETNLNFLQALAQHGGFSAGEVDTGLIDRDLVELTASPKPAHEVWVVAALASLGLGGANRPYGPKPRDPFKTLSNWRLWGDSMQVAPLWFDGAAHEVTMRGGADGLYTATLPVGAAFGPFQPLRRKGGYQLTTPERVIFVAVAIKRDLIDISYANTRHRFQIPDPLAVTEDAAAGGDQIIAPMPGLVKKLDAKPGQHVSEGDLIAIMEAMKMELRLTAPRDGVIAELLAAEGDQVEDGAVLARLEPSA
ncbi:MAG: biotin/lipoyl-binding protein, partial [Rhodobacteraceae bacterium]|nr:biotin/lipoyl-binding protein [Paracoccaceae bacterium]